MAVMTHMIWHDGGAEMDFIEITVTAGYPVSLNVSCVSVVTKGFGGTTRIIMRHGGYYDTDESYESVMKRLKGCYKNPPDPYTKWLKRKCLDELVENLDKVRVVNSNGVDADDFE